MSPFADCPIVEVRPEPAIGGLKAILPPFRGDKEAGAVASTIAALIAFANARGIGIWLADGPDATEDQNDIVRITSDVFYRHQLARRGRLCEKCGHHT